MSAPLILGTNSIKDTGFNVDNSLRFNQPDNPYLTRTISSAGSTTTVSISFWFKRGKLADDLHVFSAKDSGVHASSIDEIKITSSDIIRLENYNGSGYNYRKHTNRVFRDPSAWYSVLIIYDTSNATADDRIRIYINGVRETSFSTSVNPSLNNGMYYFDTSDPFIIGTDARTLTGASNLDGYLSEVVVVDGTALNTTDVGEFDEDTGIWKPIDVSGLTFGTNGFYLDFEDSSALGNDVSGNDNDFTVNNLTSIDQVSDSPTNNFCTLNPLDAYYASSTFSEGNCKIVTEASLHSYNTSTIGVSQGKWYCEVYIETSPHPTTKDSMIGIAGRMSESDSGFIGFYNDTYGIYGGNGNIYNNNASASYGVSHTTGDIIGIYLDLDNNKLYFAKNGTLMNSGTGKDITDPSNTKAGVYFFVADDFGNGYQGTYRINFGNPIYTLTSGNSDPNGYGNFEYSTTITGDSVSKDFYALNTKNLAEYG